MSDFVVAIGLVLVIEGLRLRGLSAGGEADGGASAAQSPDGSLRIAGVVVGHSRRAAGLAGARLS